MSGTLPATGGIQAGHILQAITVLLSMAGGVLQMNAQIVALRDELRTAETMRIEQDARLTQTMEQLTTALRAAQGAQGRR